jgi:hypothetical protein
MAIADGIVEVPELQHARTNGLVVQIPGVLVRVG